MSDPDPAAVYVAIWNNRPIGVSAHLGDIKAAAVSRESKYDPQPREYRWEQESGDESWQLLVLNAESGRWNRRDVSIHPTAIVDAPDVLPNQI